MSLSNRYEIYLSFLGAAGGLLLGQTMVASVLVLTILDLPYVYDPVLYRFNWILGLGWTVVAGDIVRSNIILLYVISYILVSNKLDNSCGHLRGNIQQAKAA